MILFIIIAIAGMIAQMMVKKRFEKYSRTPLPSNLTGADVALKMLHDNGIYDVKVQAVRGQLTDNYDPTNKTLNLSENVYSQRNVAAAAVAAHECGHAIQHANSYAWLKLRSAMVPAVNVSSKLVTWLILGGLLLISFTQNSIVLWVGIALYAVMTLFTFITLPVEIDASKRALKWLDNAGITNGAAHSQAQSALRAAAYTYVVAALGSLATLLYYISIARD